MKVYGTFLFKMFCLETEKLQEIVVLLVRKCGKIKRVKV